MTTIEKIRAEFVEHLEQARRTRAELKHSSAERAYDFELKAQTWGFAIAILDKHAADEPKEQPTESAGQMPWRLQIAAMKLVQQGGDFKTPAYYDADAKPVSAARVALEDADLLIAEHERTK